MPGIALQGVSANPPLTPVRAYPKRVMVFGDSISRICSTNVTSAWPNNVLAFNNEGWITWANRLLGQRLYFDPTLNKGVDGNRTDQILGRFGADVAGNSGSFDILFLQGGSNDVLQGSPTAAQAAANLQAIATQAVALGKRVIYLITPPQGTGSAITANGRKALQYLNTLMREWALTHPYVILIDPFRSLADPTSAAGNAITALFMGDGIHPSGGGAYRIGKAIADSLQYLFPPSSTLLSSGNDVYDVTFNPVGNRLLNPAFLTNSGGTASNCTGAVVLNWVQGKLTGTFANAEIVASVEAQSAGLNAMPGNKQVFTVSMAGKTTNESFQFVQGVSGIPAGATIFLEAEVDVSGISNMWYGQLNIGDSDNVTFPISACDGYDAYGVGSANLAKWDPQTYSGLVFRTPLYTVQRGNTIYSQFIFAFDASTSAAAVIKIGGVKLWRVN